MKILLSGASGLVGRACQKEFAKSAYDFTFLVRKPGQNGIFWDPLGGFLDSDSLEGFDVVLHLAGENIAAKLWSAKQKQIIKDSRIKSTELISRTLCKLKKPPKLFISASAIGFYGDRPLEILNESSYPVKNDFLSNTCQDWEQASKAVQEAGIRLVNARFGIVLSKEGGVLAKLLTPFQFALGACIGSGDQIMSWIDIEDAARAINHLIINPEIEGPVNITSPNPVSNREFTLTLAKIMKRPAFLSLPSFFIKLLFGEMADALLLASAKVKPDKLIDSGFQFIYPDLEKSLKNLLRG